VGKITTNKVGHSPMWLLCLIRRQEVEKGPEGVSECLCVLVCHLVAQ